MTEIQDSPHGTETILVVDDNRAAVSAIRRTLEFHGYTVVEAHSPAEALERLRTGSPEADLVVTDMIMPGMSGIALSEALRGVRPSLPILLVSGYSDQEVPHELLARARTAFLRKPFSIRELAERVRALLDE